MHHYISAPYSSNSATISVCPLSAAQGSGKCRLWLHKKVRLPPGLIVVSKVPCLEHFADNIGVSAGSCNDHECIPARISGHLFVDVHILDQKVHDREMTNFCR